MQDNLLYYSTNTYLAYHIATTFYDSRHYLWCSPVYDPSKLGDLDVRKRIPASSNPHKIYLAFLDDIETKDLHSDKIRNNKNGLRRGAIAKRSLGIIDDEELAKINNIIDNASIEDFKPLLFIIPKDLIKNRLKKVAVSNTANPLSEEYLIEDLEIQEFEIIQTR